MRDRKPGPTAIFIDAELDRDTNPHLGLVSPG
jgi:hypothetical protein